MIVMPMVVVFSIILVLGLLWTLSFLILFLFSSPTWLPRPLPSNHESEKNVLLVVAHPDDESMFFGPTLLSLASLGRYNVRVLCLSTGNADGLGSIRRVEILSACRVLKVPLENVKIVDDPALQDGFSQIWSQDLITRIIKEHVAAHSTNIIITFDKYGVSGHPNHRAVYRGVCAFLCDSAKDMYGKNHSAIEAWELISTNILRKYCGPVDVLCWTIEELLGRQVSTHCFYNQHPQRCIAAMKQHASQWIWYRRLFVIFSHYTYINVLKRIVL